MRKYKPIWLALTLLLALVTPSQAADTILALERAYRAYQRAVLAKDWDSILERVSAETRREMLAHPKEKRAQGLKYLHRIINHTKNAKVDSGKIEGHKGTLKVHVPKQKGTLTGQILLRKEAGRWRMYRQKWSEKD